MIKELAENIVYIAPQWVMDLLPCGKQEQKQGKGPLRVMVFSDPLVMGGEVGGSSVDGVFVFDCRLLPDPYDAFPHPQYTGLSPEVARWLEDQREKWGDVVDTMIKLARLVVRRAIDNGLTNVEFACCCDRGLFRSPFVAHKIAQAIAAEYDVEVFEMHHNH